MSTTASPKVQMVCAECGGTNVMRDAWACWNVETQEWELQSTFDNAHCDDCDGETSIDDMPLDNWEALQSEKEADDP
jgi:hypothetical protein